VKAIATALAVVALWLASPAAQHTFRVGVERVRVDVLVTDKHKPVVGLTAADFQISDNDVPQTVDLIDRETVPLSVSLVLDTSSSVEGDKMTHLASAVDQAIRALSNEDSASLMTFSHEITSQAPPTSDLASLVKLTAGVRASGATALRDAVYAALATEPGTESRSVMIVFSDGLDTASWLTADQVAAAAQRSNTVIYGVTVADHQVVRAIQLADRVASSVEPEYSPNQTAFLDRIANLTGGRVIRTDVTARVGEAFRQVIEELRTRYLLSYSPTGVDTPGWHTIAVRVKGRRVQVQARRGYERR
jgi:VWFA-related protein